MTKKLDVKQQPLIQGNEHKSLAIVGRFEVIDKIGNLIPDIPIRDIHLTIGKQNFNTQQNGVGINHIYYKHKDDIPKNYYTYIDNGQLVNWQATIISFLMDCFKKVNQNGKVQSIDVYTENNYLDGKYILIELPSRHKLILSYDIRADRYIIITFYKNNIRGVLQGSLLLK